MPGHTEKDFEAAIEAGLVGVSDYQKRSPASYSEALALFPEDVTGFLKDSQPLKWEQLQKLLGDKTSDTLLGDLTRELEIKGTLHVLRHGFKSYGKTFRLAYFRPNTGMNPEAAEKYGHNRFTITR
jgi:type I restriction enzyme, R subunit